MKEYINKKDIVFFASLFIVCAIFSGIVIYQIYENQKWFESLSPEEKQDYMLKQEKNYNETFIEGTIVENDSYMVWVKYPMYNISLRVSFDDEEFGVEEYYCYYTDLYHLREGDKVKCKLVTITNGYDEVVDKYIDSNYIEEIR